jgi:hypothetical protein
MEKILYKTAEAAVILLAVLFLGNLIPTTISMCIAICSKATFAECMNSVPYWLFTIIGWIIAATYLNDILVNEK